MPDAERRAVCPVCLTAIHPGDPITHTDSGRAMHADCDPRVTRCPHCDGVLNA